jgi:hypothetical protein
MSNGTYIDQGGGLFDLAQEAMRHTKPRTRKHRASTRLRVPLTVQTGQLAINPTGQINRCSTAQLTGNEYHGSLLSFELCSFRGKEGEPIPRVGPPAFASGIDSLPTQQTFEGFRLQLFRDGLCVLSGLIETEPVPIPEIDPERTHRVASAWVTGMRIHTGLC